MDKVTADNEKVSFPRERKKGSSLPLWARVLFAFLIAALALFEGAVFSVCLLELPRPLIFSIAILTGVLFVVSKIRLRIFGGVMLLLLVAGCSGFFVFSQTIVDPELDAHMRIIRKTEEKLGFTYGTPYEGWREIFVITSVKPGGLMDEAGLQEGDRPDMEPSDLIRILSFNQGKKVAIPMRRDGETIEIRVGIPDLDLSDDPYSLHWPFKKYPRPAEAGREVR